MMLGEIQSLKKQVESCHFLLRILLLLLRVDNCMQISIEKHLSLDCSHINNITV